MAVPIYPVNELWNLVPSDPQFNHYVKRDHLPSTEHLAETHLQMEGNYGGYGASATLTQMLQEVVSISFSMWIHHPSGSRKQRLCYGEVDGACSRVAELGKVLRRAIALSIVPRYFSRNFDQLDLPLA